MYAVFRRYKGPSSLIDELVRRRADVEQLLRAVPGFKSYYLMRAGDGGGASITICEDQAGTTESTRVAGDWVRQNVPAAAGSPPEVTEGEVLFNF
jgi:heme-degrading monooxygenase HmoA